MTAQTSFYFVLSKSRNNFIVETHESGRTVPEKHGQLIHNLPL